jgi:transcriptional regulator with XRE-family HTH domain
MDDVRLGTSLRVLRIRKHLRQADVARRADVRRETVSRLERGAAGRYPLGMIRAVAAALGADVDIRVRWQGVDLDRITGAAHALRTAFPADGHAIRRWLRAPAGSISALSFWSEVHPGSARQGVGRVKRVRQPRQARATGGDALS